MNKIYKFNATNLPQKNTTLVYIIPADLTLFTKVLDQIKLIKISPSSLKNQLDVDIKEYHIIAVPNVLHSFEVILEETGLYGFVQLHRFNWDFIALDTHLISLEIPQLFANVFVKEDTSLLSSVAHSIRVFNMVFKKPNMIFTYGKYSENILKMVDRITDHTKDEKYETCDFSAMIMIDRNKDYTSCLLTPVTYSGLLLEIFPAKSGTLHIDAKKNKIRMGKLDFLQINNSKSTSSKPNEVSHLRMTGQSDSIYLENRYKHFSEVINLLSAQAKLLGMEGNNLHAMQLKDMQEYVAKKLPKITSQKKDLFKHLHLCETIVNELGAHFEQIQTLEESMLLNDNRKQTFGRIQETLTTDGHKYNSLRHICLLHLTCNLTTEESTQFVTNYLNTFGYSYLTVFSNLARAKLFPEIEAINRTTNLLTNISIPKWQNRFQLEANKLKLIPSVNGQDGLSLKSSGSATSEPGPACPSYVFNGSYIPLVAQLAHFVCNSERFEDFYTKIKSIDDLKLLKYGHQTDGTSMLDTLNGIKNGTVNDLFSNQAKTLFVFITGGITYAEVAACNMVARLTGCTIVVGSDSVLSSEDVIDAAFH